MSSAGAPGPHHPAGDAAQAQSLEPATAARGDHGEVCCRGVDHLGDAIRSAAALVAYLGRGFCRKRCAGALRIRPCCFRDQRIAAPEIGRAAGRPGGRIRLDAQEEQLSAGGTGRLVRCRQRCQQASV